MTHCLAYETGEADGSVLTLGQLVNRKPEIGLP